MINERKVDHGTVTYLEKIQFLGNNLLSAHTVWVNDNEVRSHSRFYELCVRHSTWFLISVHIFIFCKNIYKVSFS